MVLLYICSRTTVGWSFVHALLNQLIIVIIVIVISRAGFFVIIFIIVVIIVIVIIRKVDRPWWEVCARFNQLIHCLSTAQV